MERINVKLKLKFAIE